jgi:hypothetical protein
MLEQSKLQPPGTAVTPSWRDIGHLEAIAVLRTGVNYGLEREIASEERRDSLVQPGPVPMRFFDVLGNRL